MWHGSKSTKQEFKFLNNENDFYLTKIWVPWLHNAKKKFVDAEIQLFQELD